MNTHSLRRLAVQGAAAFGTALLGSGTCPSALAQINPPSQFDITVDGLFTGSRIIGTPGAFFLGPEWSDVTPAAFISTPHGVIPTGLSSPLVNTLTYATVAAGVAAPEPQLYLLYDYLPRTNPDFRFNEFIADISFPLDVNTGESIVQRLITVQFRGGSIPASDVESVGVFNVFIDTDGDGDSDGLASEFGLDGAIGFGPSTLSLDNHLIIELGVPLRIPAGFGDLDGDGVQDPDEIFPPQGTSGPSGGGYSPDPAFWGANIAKNDVDPPASAAIFEITPNGSTIIIPMPEPSAALLLASGLLALTRRRPYRP